MSCGCNKMTHEPISQFSPEVQISESDTLTGRTIKHSSGKILTVSSPIRDINGSLLGYITNDSEGKIIRIFSKDVAEVL